MKGIQICKKVKKRVVGKRQFIEIEEFRKRKRIIQLNRDKRSK
jgi:hypothetical protein